MMLSFMIEVCSLFQRIKRFGMFLFSNYFVVNRYVMG